MNKPFGRLELTKCILYVSYSMVQKPIYGVWSRVMLPGTFYNLPLEIPFSSSYRVWPSSIKRKSCIYLYHGTFLVFCTRLQPYHRHFKWVNHHISPILNKGISESSYFTYHWKRDQWIIIFHLSLKKGSVNHHISRIWSEAVFVESFFLLLFWYVQSQVAQLQQGPGERGKHPPLASRQMVVTLVTVMSVMSSSCLLNVGMIFNMGFIR